MTHADTKRSTWKTYAICALFWLPLLSGVVSRLVKDSIWLGDYGATACAAEKWLQGGRIFDIDLACPGITLSMYIYHPWIAQTFSVPLRYLGQDNMRIAYAVVFALAVAALLWVMVGRRSTAPRRKRAWFGGFMVGSAIYWGNLAVLPHALIGLSATMLRRWPIFLMLAIAIGMIMKPLFIAFVAVFLLLPKPLLTRIGYAAATAILGGLPSLWFLYQGGALAEQWAALVAQVVYVDRPGDAFLGWVSMFGGDVAARATMIGYVVFAGVITACAMLIAEGLELDVESRAMLGLSLGVLLNPRLMSQDFWMLGPGLLAVIVALSARAPNLGATLERIVLGLCIVALIGNLADLADYLTKIVTLCFTLMLVFVAAWTVRDRRNALASLWGALIKGPLA
jgi:hypothetical protein